MMNRSRTRGDTARPRVFMKASGDTPKTAKEPNNIQSQLRTKSRIPKELRYDLEKALVGLCDVWFEDIKPHLLRNNIKLHVKQGPNAGETEAGGDRGCLSPSTPGCSHLDPGAASNRQWRRTANSAKSYSILPKTSIAQLDKPLQRPFKRLSPLHSPTTVLITKLQDRKTSEDDAVAANVTLVCSHVCSPQPQQHSVRPVPHQARTHSSSPPRLPPRPNTLAKQIRSKFQRCQRTKIVKSKSSNPPTKNRSTQTDPQLQSNVANVLPNQRQAKSPKRHRTALKSLQQQRSTKAQQAASAQSQRNDKWWQISSSWQHESQQEISLKRIYHAGPQDAAERQQQAQPCRPKSHSQLEMHRLRSVAPCLPKTPAPSLSRTCLDDHRLYQDDLIDILGEPYDVDVKKNYECPKREEHLATLNHDTSTDKKAMAKKMPPWR